MIYRIPYEPGAIRTGDDRTDDHDDEPTLVIPAAITREWRRRLAESQRPGEPSGECAA